MDGELKEAKNDLEDLKDFVKRWEEKIKEIKQLSLNEKQAYHTAEDFLEESFLKFSFQDSIRNKRVVLKQLGHDLYLALDQANNNYKKQFPSFWNRFTKLKLPDLVLFKK